MELIRKHFTSLTELQYSQLEQLGPLYLEWNQKINVISRKDIDSLYIKHILHSLAIAKFIKFSPGTRILDVGTGGGFPGIPLAILFPACEFHLIDSIAKKIKVVQEVVNATGLTNVKANQMRVQDIKGQYDFVVSRAVTAFPDFVSMSRHVVAKNQKNAIGNGILYLKGGDFKSEVKPFGKKVFTTELSTFFDDEYFETKKLIHLPI